ncbi:AraC family transcriptional regulator [Lutibacter sp.]|uniref:helix-turn-helix domain-containing protein n=1 Tax=Lutibacter sp. TaxID=1925666 RepID=UPI0025C478B9|nr:AraC family transcriptional regulator [Lutibacter sp.]MCF6182075.1 AraC family transcriptional regulator [Lutibacter sp.]
MKFNLNKYKNIDKSTHCILNEKGKFKVLHFNNLATENELFKIKLNDNYIQLYFCLKQLCTVAFNMEHCAINLKDTDSYMVYFKDNEMNVLFDLAPKSELICFLISLEYFHSLFSNEGNYLINFSSFNSNKPIIEPKEISPTIKLILKQLTTKYIHEKLRPIYIKGKIYELLSYYYSTTENSNTESCPYISSEETISKIKEAKQIVIENMNNPPSLNELAKQVGLNIKKLKSDFKDFYGSPVFTFLLNYKMDLAKNLLVENKYNVNEIALQLGYSTSSHFIAAFKRKFGITPKKYSKS